MGISDVGDHLEGLDHAVWSPQAEQAGVLEGNTPQDERGEEKESTVEQGPDNKRLMKFADAAMFEAAPQSGKEPEVTLLWMTPDPLGAIASFWLMYQGKPVHDLAEITDEQRQQAWADMQKTHLQAPLEVVKLHFLIENVDRAFTHQLVRQRTAVYAQESMRFAVKTHLKDEVAYPPSLMDKFSVFDNLSGLNDARKVWDDAIDAIEAAYLWLIAQGVPAEDARGLLPTSTPTRVMYVTDLRNLLEHAGNRLCTQAQYHWRAVFAGIRSAIKDQWLRGSEKWQYELIAETGFVPQCYRQGKCTFDSKIDRGCTIRPRVDLFAQRGIPSSEWGNTRGGPLLPIDESEWNADPRAAWVK